MVKAFSATVKTNVNSLTKAHLPCENKSVNNIRILVVTSCTGQKRFKPKNQLTIEDFKDAQKLSEQSQLLADAEFACPASQMYTGLQHLRVMEGVNILRSRFGKESVDVKIVSAGYGIISEEKVIVPYSVTFNDMKSDEVASWADFIRIHEDFKQVIIGYDLVFVLLGEKYLRTLKLPVETQLNQTFIFLASNNSRKYIKLGNAKSFVLTLSNADASHFGCGLVGLKGQLMKLIATEVRENPDSLKILYNQPEILKQLVGNQPNQLKLSLGISFLKEKKAKNKNPDIKKTKSREEKLRPFLDLPPAANKHLEMQYFIPEWDDKVDSGYDFLLDKFTPERDAYTDDVYAHEIYSEANYNGILVSKVVVDKKKSKRSHIEEAGGIRNYLRFSGEIMGDCGAFGYIKQEQPPYTTVEILDYYEKLGFTYGVSIDHLIVGPFALPGVREKRYDLTLRNAEEFITKHHSMGYTFKPIGVAQGWNPQKYAEAVKALMEMGYDYIALGGLARTPTKEILEILQQVYQHLTPTTRLHLFGVGRTDAIPYLRHLGITSFDSASPLRKAWFDAKENYQTLNGKTYSAIRIPFVDKHSVRIKHLLENGYEREYLKQLEQNALDAIRKYDKNQLLFDEALKALLEFDKLLELPRDGEVDPAATARRLKQHTRMYGELLKDKPWQQCECIVCKEIGVESVIFRGNDRNQRQNFYIDV